MQNGLMHLYMGDGKGKTTAAVGLAVRAAGAGENVIFAQFMKGGKTAELESLKKLEHIRILRSDKEFPFYGQMTQEQKEEQTEIHNRILDAVTASVQAGETGLIVLDEITYPVRWGMIDCEKLKLCLQLAKGKTEIVCTGRNPDAFLLECADYITEMKNIRHPYENGIAAREGIEF